MKILVADDDTLFLKMVSDILVEAGHDVTWATNGKEAIDKAVTQVPDLIILDIILPRFLGTEVSEKLRKSGRTASIPILLVTSGVAEVGEGDFLDHFQADDFLQKPFEAEELLEKVNRLAGSPSRVAEKESGTNNKD